MSIWLKNVVYSFIFLLLSIPFAIFISEQRAGLRLSSIENDDFEYWKLFAKITKERRYIEEAEAHYMIPIFPEEISDLSGSEISITGYYLPYARNDSVIIISRYPNASCFYCGQAGVESVVMVELRKAMKTTFKMDEIVTATGKLHLNNTDINQLAFVLLDASVE